MMSPPPPAPVLPKYCHLPFALQASDTSLWTALPAPESPDWSTQVPHSFASVQHFMHLGHPLTTQLRVDTAVSLILRELRAQLNELHSQLIQVIDRILLINTMVLPRLLYRTKCLPLTTDQLYAFTSSLETFVLSVLGLPSLVAKKTLYTHRSHGLGMGYFHVLHQTRVLDTPQRNPHLRTMSTRPQHPLSPYNVFLSALSLRYPDTGTQKPPIHTAWRDRTPLHTATSLTHVAGLLVYLLPSDYRPDATYTDGRKLGRPPSAGAAALLRDGRIAVCRVPGVPNSYKAELIGVLLGSHLSAAYERLRLDCQGAIASAQGTRRPIRQAFWVAKVRSSLSCKRQTLEWVE